MSPKMKPPSEAHAINIILSTKSRVSISSFLNNVNNRHENIAVPAAIILKGNKTARAAIDACVNRSGIQRRHRSCARGDDGSVLRPMGNYIPYLTKFRQSTGVH